MTTFVNDFLETTETRWSEVESLVEEAENRDGEAIQDSLCRAASILMISHIEGFIKELAKNLVSDLNRNLKFCDMPDSVKRSAVSWFYSGSMLECKHYNSVSSKLIADLEGTDNFKISADGFLFSGNGNRNPKPDIIKSTLAKFGVNDIFKNLHLSPYEQVFESEHSAQRRLQLLMPIVFRACEEFPFQANLKDTSGLKPKKYNGQTNWQAFINNINNIRHQIVHGNTFDNTMTPQELKKSINKIRLFQYLVTYIVLAKITDNGS